MKVPSPLASAFGPEFEALMARFLASSGLIPDLTSLGSPRFLARSVVPHIEKLSALFNREERDPSSALEPYWKESSNPTHLRLAYFLYFMPSNLFRVASVWAELGRLGFKWIPEEFRAIEFGAGPASGACGISAGEFFSPTHLPENGSWALIEQDRAMLELGTQWAPVYFEQNGKKNWTIRPFHRKLDLKRGFLPRTAPDFHLWVMSYYLNEVDLPASELAPLLIQSWENHLAEEGVVILVEPALRIQSRKLLELRRHLLQGIEKRQNGLQILLPCLGHQACGALQNPDDWCHEEVSWWRPPYFRTLDKMAQLDRKTLPFSYLVLCKSKRPREEILPALAASPVRHRLVSPAHLEGRDSEFYTCGQEGKRRARFRVPSEQAPLERGDILLGSEIRGDRQSSRIQSLLKVIDSLK